MSKDKQYQFLKTLCDLYDGGDYVDESKIRAVWPECPSHYEILEFGVEKYFDRNPDYQIHAYKPTGEGRAALREWKRTEETAKELQKLSDDFDKYRADEAAYKTAQELRAKTAERKGFWRNVLSSVVAGIISGLVVYYWPDIVRFFTVLFHLR